MLHSMSFIRKKRLLLQSNLNKNFNDLQNIDGYMLNRFLKFTDSTNYTV